MPDILIVNGQVVMEGDAMTGATPGGPLYGPGWDGVKKQAPEGEGLWTGGGGGSSRKRDGLWR